MVGSGVRRKSGEPRKRPSPSANLSYPTRNVGLIRCRPKEEAVADRVPLDFDPPVRVLRGLLLGVDVDELSWPTPCPDWNVAALLDHLMGLALAFTQAARKRTDAPGTDGAPPQPSAQH